MEAQSNYIVPLKRFWGLITAERFNIYPIFFYAIINGVIVLALPLGIQAILNFVLGGRLSTSWVLLVILVTLALAFSGFLQISQLYLVEKLQQRVFAKSAFEFAYRIPRMKLSKLVGKYPPELVNRFFDTVNIQKGLSKLLMDMTTALLQIFFGLLLLSVYHPFFVAFSLVLIFFVYLLFRATSPRGMLTSLKESSSKYEVAFWLEEMARTLGTFKLAGKTVLPEDRVNKLTEAYVDNRRAHFKVLIRQYIIMISFKVLIVGTLLVTGSILLINEEISVGQFVAAEVIIILVLGSIEKLILTLETVYDTLTATEKVGQIMDIELEESGNIDPESESRNKYSIEFKNVSFTYPGTEKHILKKISFNIRGGEKVVITGSVGAGKSTLLQLIGGLYDNYTGEIFINGIQMKLLDMKALRTYIGDSMSQQNIFRGTLRENITLGRPDESGENLKTSLELTGLNKYVKQLAHGLDEMLLPQGMMIPNDIVRKIILARSLYYKPSLVLLESPITQLSPVEKNNMLDYTFSQEYTMLAVSEDQELIKRADRIIELKNGKITFDGDLSNYQSR
ncbi:MAG: ATP-binding cassette domain-containing protein [Cryomorphaceae bacterium]|nr:ATP-binding cassette domain-containing protein [Cryomorphaceae bacterium]